MQLRIYRSRWLSDICGSEKMQHEEQSYDAAWAQGDSCIKGIGAGLLLIIAFVYTLYV